MRFHFWNCSGKRFQSVSLKAISMSVDVECCLVTPPLGHSTAFLRLLSQQWVCWRVSALPDIIPWLILGGDWIFCASRSGFTAFISLVCREDQKKKKKYSAKKFTAKKTLFSVAAFFECVSISNLVMEGFGGKEGVRTEG